MIKRRATPVRGGMALLAGLREIRLHVIGIRRALEISQVATDASRVRGGQVVVAIHVALRALQAGMEARQREAGGRVIERRIAPRRRGMALLAGLREIRLHVIRTRGALEVLQVAADASRIRAGQIVVVVHVALRALQAGVCTCQREASRGVVKRRARPGSGVVALLASLREARSYVIGIGSVIEIGKVAAHAGGIRAGQVVIVVDMALRALHGRMEAGEREPSRGMVKGRVQPVRRAVALFASLRECRSHVVGIGRSLEVLQVAAHTGSRGQVVIVVDVALRALQRRMRARERKPGVVVIEAGLCPRSRVVALLASLREAGTHVIRVRGALEILEVAVHAVRVRTLQAVIVVHVALSARDRCVRARQREPGRGVVKVGTCPRGGVVTLLARL